MAVPSRTISSLGSAAQSHCTAHILESIEEHNRACSIGICHEHTFYFVHLHRAKGQAEMKIENPMYVAKMDRSKGLRLGLKLDVQVSSRSLFIKEVVGGLAYQWNSANEGEKVRPGDRIVRVNNIEGDAHLMLDVCKARQMLELELHRGSAVQITTGLTAIVKQSFAHFREGQEGTVTKVDEDGDALMQWRGVGSQWVCKEDYDKFVFEDSDRYYLKRYCDFKELHTALQQKLDRDLATPIRSLLDFPGEEKFGFRRAMGNLGMSNFMENRRDGLQDCIDHLLAQVDVLEEEPLLGAFFESAAIPSVGAEKEAILKQRLDVLVYIQQEKMHAIDGKSIQAIETP